MSKNIVTVGAIVTVVATLLISGFMMMNKPKPVPAEAQVVETTQEPVVELTDSGFSPAEITIKQSQKVKFINNSSGKMSVASNPHPTHTVYPEFDQFKTSQRGMAQFEFTFEKVGTWGYHNHANPSQTGTIIVTN